MTEPHNHTSLPIRTQRRLEVKEIMQELGRHGVPIDDLAKKYNVHRNTIHKDIHQIIKRTKPEDIQYISWGVQNGYKILEKKLLTTLTSPETSSGEKINAARALTTVYKDQKDLLEAYGLKDKVADKTELAITGTTKLSIEDIKRVFEKKEAEK